MSSLLLDDAPRPRLCLLKKRTDFQGYGFNLHAEKGKAGQYIGQIDPGSPAEKAGLKQGDRIVEVNGTNIGNENHQQVVQRIKSIDNETRLLVVDAEADKYYKDKKIVVRGDLPNVSYRSSEDTTSNHANGVSPDRHSDVASTTSSSTKGISVRLCHLKIWSDFQGYGFNLHAEKGKPGQFVGKVDHGSPASLAGLQEGDRIVEVNGDLVKEDTHAEVVNRIKSNPKEVKLLVMDKETEEYYKKNDIVVNSQMSNIDILECPDVMPSKSNDYVIEADVSSNSSVKDEAEDFKHQQEVNNTMAAVDLAIEAHHQEHHEAKANDDILDVAESYEVIGNVPSKDDKDESSSEEEALPDYEKPDGADAKPKEEEEVSKPKEVKQEIKPPKEEVKPPKEEVKPHKEEVKTPSKVQEPKSPPAPVVVGGIEFAGSAAAAREKVTGRRKRDVAKVQSISAKDKYDMFMQL